jgi:hypothetical protein
MGPHVAPRNYAKRLMQSNWTKVLIRVVRGFVCSYDAIAVSPTAEAVETVPHSSAAWLQKRRIFHLTNGLGASRTASFVGERATSGGLLVTNRWGYLQATRVLSLNSAIYFHSVAPGATAILY